MWGFFGLALGLESNLWLLFYVMSGDEVTSFYDPMIAKLVVCGESRAAALKRLRISLSQYQVPTVLRHLAYTH